jgi:hypothetical protein
VYCISLSDLDLGVRFRGHIYAKESARAEEREKRAIEEAFNQFELGWREKMGDVRSV